MTKFSSLALMLFSTILYAQDSQYDVDLFCQDLNVVLQRVDVHSLNIKNHKTTRTAQGGPFKRRVITICQHGKCEITKDDAHMLVYSPNHPDANNDGYVKFPAFSIEEEKDKLLKAQNAYDVIMDNMPVDSVDLLVGKKFEKCLKDYAFFKERFDFQAYLGR